MAGLLAYAAAGGLSGLGAGITEQAKRAREDMLRQLAEERKSAPVVRSGKAKSPDGKRAPRKADAAPTGKPSVMSTAPAPPQSDENLPRPKTQAEYDRLPVGTRYIDPDGWPKRKDPERDRGRNE